MARKKEEQEELILGNKDPKQVGDIVAKLFNDLKMESGGIILKATPEIHFDRPLLVLNVTSIRDKEAFYQIAALVTSHGGALSIHPNPKQRCLTIKL